jgi:hypothetical protein
MGLANRAQAVLAMIADGVLPDELIQTAR